MKIASLLPFQHSLDMTMTVPMHFVLRMSPLLTHPKSCPRFAHNPQVQKIKEQNTLQGASREEYRLVKEPIATEIIAHTVSQKKECS